MPAAKRKLHRLPLAIFGLIFALLISVIGVSAQAVPVSLPLGQPLPGSITPPETQAIYQFEVEGPMNVDLQVLSLTPGFFPSLLVIDPSGVTLVTVNNNGTQTTLNGTASMVAGAPYRIVVQSFGSVAGQFVISAQTSTTPQTPVQTLPPGQMVMGLLDGQTPSLRYGFADNNFGMMLLSVNSSDLMGLADAPSIILRDVQTGATLGVISGKLMGNRFRLPTPGSYTLEINSDGSGLPQPFTLCLEPELSATNCGSGSAPALVQPSDAVAAVPTRNNATPPPTSLTIDPNGPCMVGSANQATVNVRSGPSTSFGIVSYLTPSRNALVIGKLADNSWVQVNNNGAIGWIASFVVFEGGICNNVPVVQPPAAPQQPVAPPVVNQPMPTDMSQPMPTDMQQPMPTDAPTQDTSLHLNANGSPESGTNDVFYPFSPDDPYITGLGGGGDADAATLGGSCSGFTTQNPSKRINYTGNGAGLLRFWYVGDDTLQGRVDPTMVIRDPDGHFHCNDDANGKPYPVIDFNNPSDGTYTIWIGGKRPGEHFSGALKLTGNGGNLP